MDKLQVQPIAAFRDNYIWVIHNGRHAVVVDPGTAGPVLDALDALDLELSAILVTHLHYDHSWGVPGLLARRAVTVFGPFLNDHDRASHPPFPKPGTVPLDCVTDVVDEGSNVALKALGLELEVLAVPGHTKGHIVFFEPARKWLFSGDTLFAGGCGKVFGGSMQAMVDSLGRLASLPGRTQVFCAHEYTVDNLRFGLAVEPSNQALVERYDSECLKRERGLATLPSTIELERATNPFLRLLEPEVLRSLRSERGVEASTRVASFEALRTWKNEFRA
jgi:hydroxyacylglutathione hydrolase